MLACHWLRADYRAGCGDEPPWTVGEQRTIIARPIIGVWGYHYTDNWYDGLNFASGPVACLVDVDPDNVDGYMGVSARRRLVAGANVADVLIRYAVECAERALAVAPDNALAVYRPLLAYRRKYPTGGSPRTFDRLTQQAEYKGPWCATATVMPLWPVMLPTEDVAFHVAHKALDCIAAAHGDSASEEQWQRYRLAALIYKALTDAAPIVVK